MIKNIGVHIKAANFTKSIAFYEALGFSKIFEYGPGKNFVKDAAGNLISAKEDYFGVTFQHGDSKLEIADGHRAVKPGVFKETISSSKISLTVQVDDLEDILKRCKKNNIPLAVGPRHYYWGTIEIVIKDPDGTVLVFIVPYSEKLALKIKADESFGKPPTN